jgi:hypothetical protein
MLTPTTLLRQSEEVAFQEIEGETIIVLPRTQAMHHLNETGSALWKFLETPRTVREAIEHLGEHYEVDRQTCEKDVLAFLQESIEKRFVLTAP